MSAHVLLNLFNELMKREHARLLSLFRNKLNNLFV